MKTPIAVLISDVHFNLNTLEVATNSLKQAVHKANDLGIILIIAGDLHDSKANIRAECLNAITQQLVHVHTHTIILVGNHDKINEKSEGASAIQVLSQIPKVTVYGGSGFYDKISNFYFIPYQHDTDKLKVYLKTIPKNATVIMHQGLSGSASGEYIQDKTAITSSDVAGLRIISGHYHTRQTIKLPNGGKWDYIGNPYSLTFGEASDPEKGYQILYADGSLEFISTNLRKHIIIELTADKHGCHCEKGFIVNTDDLVWVKVSGPKEFVQKITKEYIKNYWVREASFKLDLIPTITTLAPVKKERSVAELLDAVIDSLTDVTPERKVVLKELWKGL